MRPGFDLMVVSDEQPELLARVARVLAHAPPGRVAIQLRERALSDAELLALGRALRACTRAAGALLLVNGRADIARAIDADGVHLPEAGLTPAAARAQLGPAALIGVSRHDRDGIARAAIDGSDYATLSPVHIVPGKAPPLGIAGFAAIARTAQLPVYALGGVRLADIPALLAAGAHGVAVIREVLSAPDPPAHLASIIAALSHD